MTVAADIPDPYNAARFDTDDDPWTALDDDSGIAVEGDDPVAAGLLVGLRDGTWLDAQQFAPLAYAVPGLIPAGCTLLVGPPKAGKSWLALGIALSVASGGLALGAVATGAPRPVLLLALEDGDRRMQSRCRALLGDAPIPPGLHYLTALQRPGAVVETIKAWLARHRGRDALVVLDTLGKVMPPASAGESSYGRDYRVGSDLKWAIDADPGASLVILHHDRKSAADDFVDSVSGTHGLAGAADTVVVLARTRQETTGLLKVTGRDVIEDEYAVRIEGGTWTLDGDGLDAAARAAEQVRARDGVGDRSAEIIAHVAAHPDGVRARDVEDVFGSDARRYLARLVDAGRLTRLGRGCYSLPTPVPTVPLSQIGSTEPGMGHRDGWDTPTEGACERCARVAPRLVGGRCPSCAYPAGGDPRHDLADTD